MTSRIMLPRTLRQSAGDYRGIVWRAKRAFLVSSLVALVSAPSCEVAGDDVQSNRHPEGPVALRRVFVPADEVGAWPTGSQKFLPVERAELDALIAKVNEREAHDQHVVIARAEYSARLQGDRLVAGKGQWQMELRGPEPAFLPLPEFSVIVRNARWQSEPERSALIGAWGANRGPAASLALEVARSGTLEFDWIAPLRQLQNGAELQWSLPPAVQSELTLDLPVGKTPSIAGGVVLESSPIPAGKAAGGAVYRRWVLGLGPQPMVVLRIVDTQTASAATDQPQQRSIEEKVAYRITERGLEVTATFVIDAFNSPLREFHVPLPAKVQLISAIAQEQELSWHVVPGEADRQSSAVISLPAQSGQPLAVTVHAWQPFIFNQSWQLPRLQPAGLFWTSGEIEVAVSPSLELERLAASGCIQTGVTPGDGNAEFERHSFKAFAEDASVEVFIAERQMEASARLASMLALSDSDVTAQLVTELSVNRGSLHTLIGELAEGWVPEAIESVPSDALGEWFLDEVGGRRTIEVQLAQAAAADRAVTIKLTGRLQRSALSGPLSLDTLRIVRWRDVAVSRHLLSVETLEPYNVQPMGSMPEIARNSLSGDARELFESEESDAPVFDLTAAAADGRLRVIERPRFSADIRLELAIEGGKTRAVYHVLGRPTSSRLDRILVFFTEPLDAIPQWEDQASNSPLVGERLSSDDLRRMMLPVGGEAWVVRFARPTARPIHIVCTLGPTSVTQKSVPFMSLPEAHRQQGRVLLRMSLDELPQLDHTGLRPVAFSDSETTSQHETDLPVRAAFRYEPAQCQDPVDAPRIHVGPHSSGGVPSLIIRRIDIESFYQPAGLTHHRATYRVENYGAKRLRLPLPVGAEVSSVFVNGLAVAMLDAMGADEAHAVQLPTGATSATVVATFATSHRPLLVGSRLFPPLAEKESPICAAQWTIWVPKGYSVTGSQVSPALEVLTLRERLFGPLARPGNDRPFHPMRTADWQQLAGPFARSLGDPTKASPSFEAEVSDGALMSQAANAAPNVVLWATGLPVITAIDLQAMTEAYTQNIAMPHAAEPNFRNLAGWRAYRARLVAGQSAGVVVAHRRLSVSWAAAALLLCLLVGRSIWNWRREAYVFAVATAAACALLVPEAFAPIATGAFLGLLFSLLVRWPLRPVDEETPTRTWALPEQARVMAIVVVVLSPSTLLSQSPDAVAKKTSELVQAETLRASQTSAMVDDTAAIESVLIPTNAEGDPVGSRHYVSERFLSRLIAAAQSGNDRRWVLLATNYIGELVEAEASGVAPGNFSMLLTIEVLARDTTIVLPLVRAEANWAPSGTLDGIPIAIEWSEDGRNCAIAIVEPGRYQLALSCQPHQENQNGRNLIRLTVPPMVGATVRLQFPITLSDIDVANASMMQPVSEFPGTLVAELHAAETLQVDWANLAQSEGLEQGLHVTELWRARASQEAVEMETKWIFEGSGPPPEALTVTLDDRWKLIDGSAFERQEADTGGVKTIRIPLVLDDAARHEVSLRWRWSGDNPLGNHRLPNIKLSPVPISQRWVAVSGAPEVDCQITDAAASPATANEFLALWGGAAGSTEQLTVLANVTPDSQAVLAVRPRFRDSSIMETLDVAAGGDGLQLHYRGVVEANGLHEYRLPLEISKDIVVDEVMLSQEGQSIPVRWSRPAADSAIIFFSRPVQGEYRIEFRGHVGATSSGNYAMPYIGRAGADNAKRVQLYRDERVLAEMRGLIEGDFTDNGTARLPTPTWTARPLAAYQFDRDTFARARLVVTPNNVQTGGQTLTTLTREPDGWWATYSCDLVVERGVLDSLPLRVPATWPGPFQVESPARSSIELQSIDGEQNRLVVRLADSVAAGGTLKLQVRARVASDGTAGIAVPEIELETPLRGRQLVLLPSMLDAQPLIWTETGVRRTPLPRGFRTPEQIAARWQLFEVVNSPFRIAQRMDGIGRPGANVRLADTLAASGPLGNQLMVTRMALVTQNVTDCMLQIPEGHELVSASLDGRPAIIRQRDKSAWQISLGPPQLPQWLEIVTRTTADAKKASHRIELLRPRLMVDGVDVPVEISLWSFRAPWQAAQARTGGADIVPAVEQATLRLDRLVSIVESAAPIALESPAPDGYDWYRPWAHRLGAMRQEALASEISMRPMEGLAQITTAAEEQLAMASERLNAWIAQCDAELAQSDDAGLLPGLLPNVLSALESASPASENWIYCVADGGEPRLVVELEPAATSPEATQVFGLLAIAGAAVAAIALVRHPDAWDALCRWPHALVTVGGIAYWAWLWPSWLGLLIALAGVATSLRLITSSRTLLGDGSTILRSGRSA